EGPGPHVLEPPHGGADDRGDVGDTAAARPHGHGVPPLDRCGRRGQGLGHPPGDVGDSGACERLPDPDHARKRHRDLLVTAVRLRYLYHPFSIPLPPPPRGRVVLRTLFLATAGWGWLKPLPTPILPPEELYKLGEGHMETRRYADARDAFKKIVERHP